MPDRAESIALISPASLHAWECLGLGYLASYSYEFGFTRDNYRFFAAEFDDDETILAGCQGVDLAAFSLTSFQVDHALELGRAIKRLNPGVRIVWGGYAVSGLSGSELLERYGRDVDHFVQGPGEQSWIELLTRPAPPRVLRSPLVNPLDRVPFPDRDLIRIDRNFEKLRRLGQGRRTSMELQRGGCPFGCIFCAAGSFSRTHGKTRSAENMVSEMELLRDRYDMHADSMALLCDAEVFMTPEMERMARLKQQRGVEFSFGMNVVASTIINPRHRRILEKLVDAGCTEVWMGVESDPTLMHLTGKPIKPDQVREAFRITRDMGLKRKAYFILGFTPEETEQTILNRIPFVEELDPDVVGFTIYIPVPGSPDYERHREAEIDYAKSCEYHNTYTRTKTLSNAELHHWQQYLAEYFKDRITYRLQDNETNPIHLRDGRDGGDLRPGRSGY